MKYIIEKATNNTYCIVGEDDKRYEIMNDKGVIFIIRKCMLSKWFY